MDNIFESSEIQENYFIGAAAVAGPILLKGKTLRTQRISPCRSTTVSLSILIVNAFRFITVLLLTFVLKQCIL